MAKKKANEAFMKPVKVSAQLEAIVGKGPMPRTEVTKKIWDYIKKHDLQNPENRRNILPDSSLQSALNTKKKEFSMFELTKLASSQLS